MNRVVDYLDACHMYAKGVIYDRRSRSHWDDERHRIWNEMSADEQRTAHACTNLEVECPG